MVAGKQTFQKAISTSIILLLAREGERSASSSCKAKDFFNKYAHEKLISIVPDAIVEERRRKETHAGHSDVALRGGTFREPIKAYFTRADNAMKDANDGQSCLKSVCNRTIRPPSFTVPSNPRGFAAFQRRVKEG